MLFLLAYVSFVHIFCISSQEYKESVPGNCTGPEKCCAGYRWDEDASSCIKCRKGYIGLNCEKKCPYPTYGVDCQDVCNCIESECDITHGCKKCDNLSGINCEEQCPYPTFGKGCRGKCHCAKIDCDIKLGCTRGQNTLLDEKNEKNSEAPASNPTQPPLGTLFVDFKGEMQSYLFCVVIGIVLLVILICSKLLFLVIPKLRVKASSRFSKCMSKETSKSKKHFYEIISHLEESQNGNIYSNLKNLKKYESPAQVTLLHNSKNNLLKLEVELNDPQIRICTRNPDATSTEEKHLQSMDSTYLSPVEKMDLTFRKTI